MSMTRYWRDISAILGLKALAIGLIYILFFAGADGSLATPAAVFQHLFSPGAGVPGVGHD